ncbi:60S ribosomal protein L3 [Diplonema papillatum]|nr:60S ribosomal protein L3 [Diplonema papillatum]KAJ9462211.1 60S ribosomal protein L3 [Diplonema papillatum]
MSHRKFEQPRHGHLGYLPRKRCRHIRGRVRSFPIDQPSQEPHLTAFLAYKAGMTHIVRDLDRPGSKMHKKEVCEPVSILDCPAMAVVGIVGYKPSARGMRTVCTVWTQQLSESVLRRYYRSWYAAKKKAFTKHIATYQEKAATEARDAKFARLVKNATVLRVICHTQPNKLKLGQKKAHIAEIQVNGGSMEDKLKFAKGLLENQFTVGQVFKESENCDIIGVTRGHGFEGVVHRWGVSRLPRKSHRGLRKVACIGAWHPSRVAYTVARPGQNGFHHRTELNKKIYKIGTEAAKCEKGKGNATTPLDITSKHITPLGGFVRYGVVNNEYVMVKGSVPGPSKRVLTLRRPIAPQTHRAAAEQITLKFIDTSSKQGHGHFQTQTERAKFMGLRKKDIVKEQQQKA